MTQPSSEFSGLVVMIEAEHPLVVAAILAPTVLRPGRTQVLRWGRREAVALRLATPGPMIVVGLASLPESPANDAFAVRRLAFGAVTGMPARPPVVSGSALRFRFLPRAHEPARIKENPGGVK